MLSQHRVSTLSSKQPADLVTMFSSKHQYDAYRHRTSAIVEMMGLSKELALLKSCQDDTSDTGHVQAEDLSLSFIEACKAIHQDETYKKANRSSLWHHGDGEVPSLSSTSTVSESGSSYEEDTHTSLMPFPETAPPSGPAAGDTYFDFEVCPEDINTVTIRRVDDGVLPTDQDWKVAIAERNRAYAELDIEGLASQCSTLNLTEGSEPEMVSQLRHAVMVEQSRLSETVRQSTQHYGALENALKNIHALHGPHNGYDSEVWGFFNQFQFFRDASFATDVPYIHAPKPRRPRSRERQVCFNNNVLVTSQELVDRHWHSKEGITTMTHRLSFQSGRKFAHRKSLVRKKALGFTISDADQFMLRRYDFFARIRDFTLCRPMPMFVDSEQAELELQWISNGIQARLQNYEDVEALSGPLLKLADLKVNYQYMQDLFLAARRQGSKGTSIPSFEYMVHWRQHMDAYTLLRANRVPQMFSDHLLDEEITQALSEQAAFEASEKRTGKMRLAHLVEQTGSAPVCQDEEKMSLTELNEAIFELWAQLELLEMQPKLEEITQLTELYEARRIKLVHDIGASGFRAREIQRESEQWRANIMEDINEFWKPIHRAEILAKHNLCASPLIGSDHDPREASPGEPVPAPLLKTGRKKPTGTVKFAGEPAQVAQICDIDANMSGPVRSRSVSLPSVLRPAIPTRNRSRSLC